jgi:hypothetical protein
VKAAFVTEHVIFNFSAGLLLVTAVAKIYASTGTAKVMEVQENCIRSATVGC